MIDAEQAMKELVAKGIKVPPQPKMLLELIAPSRFETNTPRRAQANV